MIHKTFFIFVFVAAFCLKTSHAAQSPADLLAESTLQGGLIVHLGCGDATQTAALHANPTLRVHGLDRDPANIAAARKHLQAQDLYGPISVDQLLDKSRLPYTDNLVNLLIADDPSGISEEEIIRVLVPNGIAYLHTKNGQSWKKITKPRPEEMDEWTHHLHSTDNNPVAGDRLVGQPDSIQWMAEPKFSRAHEQQASFSACVTQGGRIFYIMDDAPRVDIRLPAQWILIARDAFNGTVLWKRELGDWVSQYRRFRSGPANLPFRLVAADDKLFVTLDFTGPVQVIDAKTGETIRTIANSENTKQIIYDKGVLTLLIDDQVNKMDEIDAARRRGEFIPRDCRIMKVDVETGEPFWVQPVAENIFPCMALKNGRVFAQTPTRVFALDYESGRENWNNDFQAEIPVSAGKLKNNEMQWEAPTLVVGDTVIYVADFKKVHAYNAGDGELLWTGDSTNEYNAPADVILVNDLVWMRAKGGRAGIDPLTGEVKHQIETPKGYMHPRCYRGIATGDTIMAGEMGVQMINTATGDVRDNDWIRGTCQLGVMPANGLLYVPPDSCACNMKTKLSGIYAFASRRQQNKPQIDQVSHPLEKGPAFGKIEQPASSNEDQTSWPTFRASPSRSGISPTNIGENLTESWSAQLPAPLSGVTVADGIAFVSAIDQHTLHALDSKTGEPLWQFTAGARIDSPPTLHNGGVYFGSADGWVYSLRAADGELAWRFRAAPDDRLISIRGQLESEWPVHGAVLIQNDTLMCSAGRSSYMGGGIHLHQLDPATGKQVVASTVYSPDPETGAQPDAGEDKIERRDVEGLLSDILLADGADVYMRQAKLDFASGDESATGVHLFSPLGFLDDTWWHRAYWLVNDTFTSHWSGWWKAGNEVASGRILSYNDKEIYGFGRDEIHGGNTGQWRGGEKYHLFAHDRTVPKGTEEVIDRKGNKTTEPKKPEVEYRWTAHVPLLATSLAVADDTVFIAGPPDYFTAVANEGEEALNLEDAKKALDAWTGKSGGILYAASATDGTKRAQIDLPAPTIFDGLAAADNKLYLALQNGQLLCLASPE
ncbi:MAG: PQQ-binding-like beta-propeller repeat protein [Verrucomicrobiota bacterium]